MITSVNLWLNRQHITSHNTSYDHDRLLPITSDSFVFGDDFICNHANVAVSELSDPSDADSDTDDSIVTEDSDSISGSEEQSLEKCISVIKSLALDFQPDI